jgi:ATP-dependent Clp protease protease subunit
LARLKISINSGGGDVFAGQAIHSILRRHKAHKTVYIDGLAASIASVVAMAGDRVVMPKNAMMMIHNPWTVAMGDARDFRKLADTLDQLREGLIAAYQHKAPMDRSEMIRLLNAETWMTAEEAVQMGFADEIEQSKKVKASVVRPGVLAVNDLEIDVSKYTNTPDFAAALRDAAPVEGEERERTKRELERALRDAGYSQNEAKRILAGRYPVEEVEKEPEAREVPPGTDDAVQRERERSRARIEVERLRSMTMTAARR